MKEYLIWFANQYNDFRIAVIFINYSRIKTKFKLIDIFYQELESLASLLKIEFTYIEEPSEKV